AVSLGFAPAPFLERDTSRLGARALEGVWVRMDNGSLDELTIQLRRGADPDGEISGVWTVRRAPTGEVVRSPFTLRPAVRPEAIDLHQVEGRVPPFTWEGIWRVEKDTLWLYYNVSLRKGRPAGFGEDQESVYRLLYKRKRP